MKDLTPVEKGQREFAAEMDMKSRITVLEQQFLEVSAVITSIELQIAALTNSQK